MRLTSRSEYALLALIALARRDEGDVAPAEALAEAQGIPLRFLEQILPELRRAGLVRAQKGQHGGYCLARPAREITLAAVLRAVGGALAPTESVSTYFYHSTPIEREESLVKVFKEIRDLVADKLEHTTLADVCGGGKPAAPRRRSGSEPRHRVRARVAVAAVALALLAGRPAPGQQRPSGTVSISGAWALYPLAIRWAEEFHTLHPEVNVDVSAGGAGKGMTDVLAGAVEVGMVSREVSEAEAAKGAVAFVVAKDAVVAMVNARNPVLEELLRRGVTREMFGRLWVTDEAVTWGQVAGRDLGPPVRAYTRSDACGAAETWARFLGKNQEDLKGIGVYGDPGLGEAARRDPLAIGYNNVNFAYDPATGKPVSGLEVVPLDVDGNGLIDPAERFYATRTDLLRAIADGRYPSPPARDLFLVTRGVPRSPSLRAFLDFVLGVGQRFVAEAGYISPAETRLAGARRLLQGAP